MVEILSYPLQPLIANVNASDDIPNVYASAERVAYGNYAYRAVDRASTFWYAGTVGNHWWKIDFKKTLLINKITILPAVASGTTMALKDFTLYGSNDDVDYTPLHSDTMLQGTGSLQTFEFGGDIPYRYFKMDNLTTYATNTASLGFNDISFFGYEKELYVFRYALYKDGTYYYYDDEWKVLSTTKPTKQEMLDYGAESIGLEINDFIDLYGNDFRLYRWSNEKIDSYLKAQPKKQLVLQNSDISLLGVETIDSVKLNATGNAKIAISFDSGITWLAYKNGSWETVDDAHSGMTADEINALTKEQIDEIRGDSQFVQFSYSLSDDAEVDKIEMRVTLQGTERILPSDAYDLDYDFQNKTIIYTLKRDMTLSVNYVDA